MAKKKKVTRKQLLKEPDEFLTFSARLFQFTLEHKYHLFGALGGIILLVLIVTGIRYYSQQRSNEAFSLLEKGRVKYQTLLNECDPRKAIKHVEKQLEQILNKYSDKVGGKLARVTYANICYNGGNPDKAIALYQKALNDFDEPFYKDLILNDLGYAYEQKGAFKEAAEYFEKIVAGGNPVLKSDALYSLGRLYAALGNVEKSNTAYQKIISEQPDSIYIDLVKERAGK